ncbi:MAG: 16S rRNA (adenine(1518)-N(6)/adenine(1519)-N(6))-dimethyltransferase RsmA, partial [Clostridiales bacterium]|jgi:16S rRNA (adenine1518-N6/adenine1519-N6)-dimethyltransferase|nr:16S rRNA (adenine(1518)-N(6)/adenine(1519)-N(6))-dimethyltransferase RsmA [Clostridiales bacterium]
MNVKEVLARTGFRFTRSLGQNFILDENLLAAVAADAGVTAGDTVIEIGAGAGTLTRILAARAARVIAYEIDQNLRPVLAETLADCENVTTVFADILRTPRAEVERAAGGPYKVVANLPYYITTPILFYFLEQPGNLVSLTVMVQREVADRLCAPPGGKAYGALTASAALRAKAVLTRPVGRACFTPAPNVDSAVVRLDLYEAAKTADFTGVNRLIKAAFSMRRKTLVNNLTAAYGIPRETAEAALSAVGIDRQARAETVAPPAFLSLAASLSFE